MKKLKYYSDLLFKNSPIPTAISFLKDFIKYLLGKHANNADFRAEIEAKLNKVKIVLYSELEHWYVLVSILVSGGIFIMMGAGRDVAMGLFDRQDLFFERISFVSTVSLVIFIYALTCWRLPIHFISDTYLHTNFDDNNYANQPKTFVHPTRQAVYRANGVLIFSLIILWLVATYFNFSQLIGFGFLVLTFIVLWTLGQSASNWFEYVRKKWQTGDPDTWKFRGRRPLLYVLLWGVPLHFVILAAIIFFTTKGVGIIEGNFGESRTMALILSGHLGTVAIFFWILANYYDTIAREQNARWFPVGPKWWVAFGNAFLTVKSRKDILKQAWKRPFLYLHILTFFTIVFTVLFYYFASNLQVNNPLFAVIFGASFIVYVLDWVNYLFFREEFIMHRWFLLIMLALFGLVVGYNTIKGNFSISFVMYLLFFLVTLRWAFKKDPTLPNDMNYTWLGYPSKTLKGNQLQLFSTGLIAFIVFNLFSPNHASHNAKLTNTEGVQKLELMPLETYIEGWLAAKTRGSDTQKPFDIYILAGQGGGSRAAYWFSKAVTELDAQLNRRFRERVLAFSTVSGSSFGAQGLVAYWHDNPTANDTDYALFSRRAFSHNYLSGGLADLFFRDNLASLLPNAGNTNPLLGSRGSRNWRLQKEEAARIDDAIKGVDWDEYGGFPLKASLFGQYDATIAERDFWSFYYQNNQPTYRTPLFFANTTQAKEGKRSFVSPVKVESGVFPNTYNLTDLLRKHGKSIALTGVANLSELFPYISASTRFNLLKTKNDDPEFAQIPAEAEEYFVDGGYFENYGLTTAEDIYRVAKKVADKNYPNVRLNLVTIANAQPGTKSSLDPVSQILAPPLAIYNTAFGGHAESARVSCIAAHDANHFFEIILDESKVACTEDKNSKKQQYEEVPLSRVLSTKMMNVMDCLAKSDTAIGRLVARFDEK